VSMYGTEQHRAMPCFPWRGYGSLWWAGPFMSETRSERPRHPQALEANSRAPGSQSLQAGSEFLKAIARDLAGVASRLRHLLSVNRRRTRPSAPRPISEEPSIGRMLWRLSIALFGVLSICAGALSAVTLWVLLGAAPQPQKSRADTLGSHSEATKGASLGGAGPLNATEAVRVESGPEPRTQGRPDAETTSRSIALSGSSSPPGQTDDSSGASTDGSSRAANEFGSSSRDAISMLLGDLRPGAQCSVELCAARYKSFRAADCTYQPYGGGPRSLCELSPQSADARRQTSEPATDPRSEAQPARVAEGTEDESRTPAPAGGQCNIDLCAATYASFHASDCTYQPYGGGPRQICER
jgi:hypothetical protein